MSSKSPEPSGKLSSSVKPRHVTMISLGGTIGAGLFIGIAEPLTQAGPLGTILAYFAAGLVMLGTMMCLGELATSFPHSGSFQYYAYKFFPSPLISYTIGWMYWLSWVFCTGRRTCRRRDRVARNVAEHPDLALLRRIPRHTHIGQHALCGRIW